MVDGAFDLLESRATRSPLSREKYVCVEPGHVEGYITLPAEESWTGQQILKNGL